MATSDVKVTPGTGKNVATYSISEDAETKDIQRVVLNDSTGAEVVAVTTSTKGNPTANMLTTQPGNEVLIIGSTSLTTVAIFWTQQLNTDGLSFRTLALQCTAIGVGATIVVQGSNDNATWITLRITNSVSDSDSGSMSAAGLFVVDCPYEFVRVSQTAISSGTSTIFGMFSRSATPKRQVAAIGPVSIGGTANTSPLTTGVTSRTANPAAVTTGQIQALLGTAIGALIQKPYSIPEADWFTGATPITLTNADQAMVAAAGAGIRNYLTHVSLTAGTTFTANTLQFRDGTTVLWEMDFPAGAGVWPITFPTPLKTSANAALNVKATGAVTGTFKINGAGYQAP